FNHKKANEKLHGPRIASYIRENAILRLKGKLDNYDLSVGNHPDQYKQDIAPSQFRVAVRELRNLSTLEILCLSNAPAKNILPGLEEKNVKAAIRWLLSVSDINPDEKYKLSDLAVLAGISRAKVKRE